VSTSFFSMKLYMHVFFLYFVETNMCISLLLYFVNPQINYMRMRSL